MFQIERLEQAEAILTKIRQEMEQGVFDDYWLSLMGISASLQVEINRIVFYCNREMERRVKSEVPDD